MAVFGAPLAEPQHATLACRSALDMLRALQTLRESWRARGIPAIDIGVGWASTPDRWWSATWARPAASTTPWSETP
jgi:adenylate cyclase